MIRRALALSAVVFATPCCTPPPPDDVVTADACEYDGFRPLDAGTCPVWSRDESHCMELTVGTGRDGTIEGFEPLVPGSVLFITPGEQGAQHIVLGFRGRDFNPTGPLVDVRIVHTDDCIEVGRGRFRYMFRPDPADTTRLAIEGIRILVDDNTNRLEYCTVLDRDVDLVVNFDDGHGHRAHREVRVHIGGIDPTIRQDVREAWLRACGLTDAGTGDGE